ncbi:hypothetical protein V565_204370, partial [Rhizoctonia solani 123E]
SIELVWLVKNIKKHTSCINRRRIATGAILHSGTASACFTTTSTNSSTPSTPICALFTLTLIPPRCGSTWDHFTKAAIIESMMRSMPMLDNRTSPGSYHFLLPFSLVFSIECTLYIPTQQ